MVTTVALRNTTYVRANWGRWIADCPSPFCLSALQVFPGQELFRCLDCDTEAEIAWPAASMVDGIERLLIMRPDPMSRNWDWGETLSDLLNENMLHGVLADDRLIAAHPGGTLLSISGDVITADTLPVLSTARFRDRRQLGRGQ